MALRAGDSGPLLALLSAERLSALTALTGSSEAAIELHQATLKMGMSLMLIIATIEIALRNAICDNLAAHFAQPGWLLAPPQPFAWREPEQKSIQEAFDRARRAEYAKLSQAEKHALDAVAFPVGRPVNQTHLARAKGRRRQLPVSDGKVVAELSFYIWKRLYGPDYEHSLWRPTLKRTFPNKATTRARVAETLETLYQSRNRLAHHEPVLHQRLYATLDAATFVIENLGAVSTGPDTPLSHLLEGDMAATRSQADALHGRLDSYRTR